jgi:hypothetical protein
LYCVAFADERPRREKITEQVNEAQKELGDARGRVMEIRERLAKRAAVGSEGMPE